ncbi:MAG: TraB/GumN family protein [Cytophagaceae bacterium]|jgi:hypothetical protein|nr:TraB/GumN family protein [Cytophagaceae bacterium]
MKVGIWISISFLLGSLQAAAQLINTEALLWELSHDSIPEKSYLFGTMHVQDKRAFDFPDSLIYYLEHCQQFAGELDMEEVKSSLSPSELLLPRDLTLKDLLLPHQYKAVRKVCKKQFGPLENMLVKRIKPIFTSALLSEKMLKREMPQALDEYLQRKALASQKKTLGLESAQEQLQALSSMSLQDQALQLYEEATHLEETRQAMNAMTDWYHDGRLDSLYYAVAQDSMMQGAVGEALLDQRNQTMSLRLHEAIQQGSVFCAIGAAHLPGPEGVLALMQKRGYRIRPIPKKK